MLLLLVVAATRIRTTREPTAHPRQVYRMLPGGLKIMGAYLFADTRALSAMLPTMHRFLHSIR
jgi:hypothetical protein